VTARKSRKARRIVVKVGSSSLTRDGLLLTRKVGDLVRQISALMDGGHEVVLVSSGAIALGSAELGWKGEDRSLREKQAAAAVGQIGLSELYRRHFARRKRRIGQVLLTRSGLTDRERFLNARHTFLELIRIGVVPVVNENDTVATEEILFGDNDNLSATIVSLIDADLLVILTDVDGLFESPPTEGQPAPRLIEDIAKITPAVRRSAGRSESATGRGGMITKLEAAQIASRSGAGTVICNAGTRDILLRVASGERIGTRIEAGERMASRKHWLAFTTRSTGELVIDDGAHSALGRRGRSLLAAGVREVRGKFRVGDAVTCVDREGNAIARGLVGYNSTDLGRIAGLPTPKAKRVLGYWNGDEIIHRDDLVLLET
jgi:glutamate 5-kinase